MSARTATREPTHTCTSDTCWAEHADRKCLHRRSRRFGKGSTWDFCGLEGIHRFSDDATPHEYTLRLGPSRAQAARARRIALTSALSGIAAGTFAGVVAAILRATGVLP